LHLGLLHLQNGEAETAIAALERSLDIVQRWSISIWFHLVASPLGLAYALAGHFSKALRLLEEAVEDAAARGKVERQSLRLARLGEGYLLAGRMDQAITAAQLAADFSLKYEERGNQAWALRLLGGTMRILYDTNISKFYQYIGYFNPLFFKAYGTFNCLYKGMVCTQDLETRVGKVNANGVAKGQVTSTGMVSRFLLDPTLFMATVPTSMAGRLTYRKIADPPVISKAYYLHLLAPWTTGKVGAYNVDSMFKIRPTIT